MNSIENFEKIEELLPRYIDGQLSSEDHQKVERWISESDEHSLIVRQMSLITLAVDYHSILHKVNTQQALKKIKRKSKKNLIAHFKYWAVRAAAILFIPLIGLLFYQHHFNIKKTEVQQIEIKTNPGMITSFLLPDSTQVYLNSESTLKYPSSFDDQTRTVVLEGEAYFKVAHNIHKKFVVKTLRQTSIEVHGTQFNVEAYANDENITTTLVKGKVSFHYPTKNNTLASISMLPGQRAVFNNKSQNAHLYKTTCQSEVSWINGEIVLDDTSLKDVLRILEKRFNVEFEINNLRIDDYAFTGTFTNQRLERILEYFKVSSNIRWRYIDDKNIRTGKMRILLY